MAFRKLSTPSLKEVFTQEIENMILSGELKVGDALPSERELVKSMGVSLSVITAGIADLEHKGFVEIRPRKGVFVSDYIRKGSIETLVSIMRYNNGLLSDKDINAFIETRIVMEQLAVGRAIEHASDEDIRSLSRHLDALKNEKSSREFINTLLEFYHELYLLSENLLLPLIFYSFRIPVADIYERYINKNGLEHIYSSTRTFYDHLCSRDSDKCLKHIEVSLSRSIKGENSICSGSADRESQHDGKESSSDGRFPSMNQQIPDSSQEEPCKEKKEC